ncbi:hypothetical protein ACP70R_001401 [Stipagrostis hirtigluma subsp. patula]
MALLLSIHGPSPIFAAIVVYRQICDFLSSFAGGCEATIFRGASIDDSAMGNGPSADGDVASDFVKLAVGHVFVKLAASHIFVKLATGQVIFVNLTVDLAAAHGSGPYSDGSCGGVPDEGPLLECLVTIDTDGCLFQFVRHVNTVWRTLNAGRTTHEFQGELVVGVPHSSDERGDLWSIVQFACPLMQSRRSELVSSSCLLWLQLSLFSSPFMLACSMLALKPPSLQMALLMACWLAYSHRTTPTTKEFDVVERQYVHYLVVSWRLFSGRLISSARTITTVRVLMPAYILQTSCPGDAKIAQLLNHKQAIRTVTLRLTSKVCKDHNNNSLIVVPYGCHRTSGHAIAFDRVARKLLLLQLPLSPICIVHWHVLNLLSPVKLHTNIRLNTLPQVLSAQVRPFQNSSLMHDTASELLPPFYNISIWGIQNFFHYISIPSV